MLFLTGAGWRAVAMFHLPVVLEKGHVVGGGLDTKYLAELVIHLDGGIAEAMLDACAFDPGRELRTEFLRQLWGDLTAEKSGDLFGFHAQHRLPDQLFIERPQRGSGAEHQIGGVFHLHQTPVVGLAEHVEHWAALRGSPSQSGGKMRLAE